MKQIIITDDDADYLVVLHYNLVRAGFAVDTKNELPSAEDLISRYTNNPSLMLLEEWVDNQLTIFLNLAFELYNLPKQYPIILMSDAEHARSNAYSYAKNGQVSTTVNIDELRRAMNRYCN